MSFQKHFRSIDKWCQICRFQNFAVMLSICLHLSTFNFKATTIIHSTFHLTLSKLQPAAQFFDSQKSKSVKSPSMHFLAGNSKTAGIIIVIWKVIPTFLQQKMDFNLSAHKYLHMYANIYYQNLACFIAKIIST